MWIRNCVKLKKHFGMCWSGTTWTNIFVEAKCLVLSSAKDHKGQWPMTRRKGIGPQWFKVANKN